MDLFLNIWRTGLFVVSLDHMVEFDSAQAATSNGILMSPWNYENIS